MKARLKIFGVEDTVTRPILTQVLKNLAKEIGCRSEPYLSFELESNLFLAKNKKGNAFKNYKSDAYGKISENIKEILFLSDFSETVEEGFERNPLLQNPDTLPIFFDKDINFRVNTIMQRKKVEMTVEYITTDRTYLQSVVNMLGIIPSTTEGEVAQNIQYSYLVPEALKHLIKHIHTLKMNRENIEDRLSLEDYIKSIGDSRLSQNLTPDGNSVLLDLSIVEKQMHVRGRFTGDFSNMKIEQAENNAFNISFSFTFTYETPLGLQLDIPLLVYNQVIDKKFMAVNSIKENSYHLTYTTSFQGLMKLFRSQMPNTKPRYLNNFLRTPLTDEPMKVDFPKFYNRLFTSLIFVDANDPYDICNIKDFEHIEFKEQIVKFLLESERENVGKPLGSYLWFGLYEDKNLLYKETILLTEEGNLKTNFPMDVKKTYRLACFILNDLDYLSNSNRTRIQTFLKDNIINNANEMKTEVLKAIRDYDNDIEKIKTEVLTIKNKYLSTLELVGNIYKLSEADKNLIKSIFGEGESLYKDIKVALSSVAKKPEVTISRDPLQPGLNDIDPKYILDTITVNYPEREVAKTSFNQRLTEFYNSALINIFKWEV